MILSEILDISSCEIKLFDENGSESIKLYPESYLDGVYNLFLTAELLDTEVACVSVQDSCMNVFLKPIPEGCGTIEDNPFK